MHNELASMYLEILIHTCLSDNDRSLIIHRARAFKALGVVAGHPRRPRGSAPRADTSAQCWPVCSLTARGPWSLRGS